MIVMEERGIDVLQGKTILVTGGTGSFGKTFVKEVLMNHNPEKVIIFSRDEWKQWEMRRSCPYYDHEKLRYFLGDVRDKDRVMRAFRGVDLVVHAAALKQVPTAEYNPSEYVKTNIEGAMNVIDAAIDCGVDKVIALSTDKAVNPVNLYGATKLCSDKLFVAGNVYVGKGRKTRFSVVRYGNVLGSRGSIIPRWKQMLKEGATSLPITHLDMTRFWITLRQAVDFVINSFRCMVGGEIFVPRIPSMKIVDLADAVAPGISKSVCGIRPGEKLHELLVSKDDASSTYEADDYYVILSKVFKNTESAPKDYICYPPRSAVPSDFEFSSDKNEQWLTKDDIRELLEVQHVYNNEQIVPV